MNGLSIQRKVAAALGKLQGSHVPISLRETRRSGGDALLGTGGSVRNVDTVIDPVPTVRVLTTQDIQASNGLFQAGDYRLMIAGSIDETLLRTNLLVMGDTTLQVVHLDAMALGGVVVMWTVTARTLASGA